MIAPKNVILLQLDNEMFNLYKSQMINNLETGVVSYHHILRYLYRAAKNTLQKHLVLKMFNHPHYCSMQKNLF